MNPNESSASSNSLGDDSFAASTGTAVRDAKQKVQRAASDVLSKAKETAGEVVGAQKEAAAEGIKGYSSALHESARSMEEQDPNIAHFAHGAADRLQQVADYVREADYTRLRQDAESVARRHPALFIGGMLVAGLVLGNLAKASTQALRESGGRTNRNDDRSTGENDGPRDFGDEGDEAAFREDDAASIAERAPVPAPSSAFGGGSVSTGPVNF